MKKIILIILSLLVLHGCSMNPAFKRGAKYGVLTGVVGGAALAAVELHPKNGNEVAIAIIITVCLSGIGALVGGTIEYISDDRKEVQEG